MSVITAQLFHPPTDTLSISLHFTLKVCYFGLLRCNLMTVLMLKLTSLVMVMQLLREAILYIKVHFICCCVIKWSLKASKEISLNKMIYCAFLITHACTILPMHVSQLLFPETVTDCICYWPFSILSQFRQFQWLSHLPITGRLDGTTLLKMASPRCGVKDRGSNEAWAWRVNSVFTGQIQQHLRNKRYTRPGQYGFSFAS